MILFTEQEIKNNVNEYDLQISSNLTNSLFVSLYDFSIYELLLVYNFLFSEDELFSI